MSRAKILAGALAACGACAALIAPWEGRELRPYRDLVGVVTVCYGQTQGVQQRTYTPAECEASLKSDTARHLLGVARCIDKPLDPNEWVAVGSLAYNAGVAAICRSTLVKKINSGAPASEWCREILKWDRAGGKRVRGLTRRRQAEYQECIK